MSILTTGGIQVNENLTWHFDLPVIEWLIVLIMLVVLGIVGAVVTHRTLKAVKGAAGQSSKPAGDSNPWHALENARVFTRLDAGPDGLAKDEVNLRLGEYGPNRLPEARTRGPLVRFFYQFHNVLIYVLLAASGVTAMLGHWVDAGVILGVVVVNAVIGFVQEGKAENALRAIRQMLSPQAMVLRDGQRLTIPSDELVPGDVVFLQSGDKVPADLRLFRVKSLQIQESVLTGESVAVEKCIEPVAGDAVLGDRRQHGVFGHTRHLWAG